MKMRTLRKLKNLAPRNVRRARSHTQFDVSDATMEPSQDPAPEAVFDRITGPYGRRHAYGFDEET
jgi:hypothetical protein